MKVLLVLGETPLVDLRGGGIATYVRHAVKAHISAGNDVRILTWHFIEDSGRIDRTAIPELPTDRVTILRISRKAVTGTYPRTPFTQAASQFLAPEIIKHVRSLMPDVLETSDYHAPLFGYLMHRRAGMLRDIQHIPVIAVNHGLTRPILRYGGLVPERYERQNHAAERIQLIWADRVICPSEYAKGILRRQISDVSHVDVVAEPYHWRTHHSVEPDAPRGRFVCLGRASIAKGLDRVIHFMNAVRPHVPVSSLTIIGRSDWIPYRESEAAKYIATRLHPEVERVTTMTGGVPAADVPDILAGGGFSLNFSRMDTFNYAFLEQLDAGLVPITAQDTAMAEFYPRNCSDMLLPAEFVAADVERHIRALDAGYATHYGEIRRHAANRADPIRYVGAYAAVVEAARLQRTTSAMRPLRRFSGEDVSILVTVFNSGPSLRDAVLSVQDQTVRPREILIADDGSTNPATRDILAELESAPGVKVLRYESNEGLSATRNKLLSACTTELCMFLDHDDRLATTFVEQTLQAMNTSDVEPTAVIAWRKHFGGDTDLRVDFNFDDYEVYLANVAYLAALLRTDVARSLGFVPSVRNGEADDWDFWLRFKAAGHRLVCVPQPLFYYHVAPGSMSWPWSIGQAAGTAALVAPSILKAIREDRVPEDLLQELIDQAHRTAFESHRHAVRSTAAENREAAIQALKAKRRVIGRFLELCYKGSAFIAARL